LLQETGKDTIKDMTRGLRPV